MASSSLIMSRPCDIALPEITTPPSDLVLHAGSPGVLECTARGIPEPNVTWYRDGIEIQNGTLENVFLVETTLSSFTVQSVLNIEIAASILGGNLTCRASNEHGEAVTESSLTVLTGKGLRI